VHVTFIANQHARRTLAGTQAFGELESNAAIGRRLAWPDAEPLAQLDKQFFAPAQHAGDAAANPHAAAAKLLFVMEKTVKGHCVRDFSRMQFQQFGNLNDGLGRHDSQRIMHNVQRG